MNNSDIIKIHLQHLEDHYGEQEHAKTQEDIARIAPDWKVVREYSEWSGTWCIGLVPELDTKDPLGILLLACDWQNQKQFQKSVDKVEEELKKNYPMYCFGWSKTERRCGLFLQDFVNYGLG